METPHFPMLRLLHTADWHLGHQLHGVDRAHEHRCFLDWLLDVLEAQRVDALLIAGDIFDSANPPVVAQAMFYEFLANARRRCPRLDMVIIAGNHDSPARLEAPEPLFRGINARVVGLLPRAGRDFEPERLLVPLHDAQGEVAGLCAAVPFLRPADLPVVSDDEELDPMVEGVRQIYAQAAAAARAQLQPHQALVLTGHCYLARASLSALSERKVLRGNQHALPADIFPEDCAYAALGHLHLAQWLGRESIRYSGSPLPLALDERVYRHQVVLADLQGPRCVAIRTLPVPRVVPIHRLPAAAPAPLDEVLAQLKALDLPPVATECRPLLDVQVLLEQPEPTLRRQVETLLAQRPARLARIQVHYTGSGEALADSIPTEQLATLDPETVFRRRYAQDYRDEPDRALLDAFHSLLEEAQQA